MGRWSSSVWTVDVRERCGGYDDGCFGGGDDGLRVRHSQFDGGGGDNKELFGCRGSICDPSCCFGGRVRRRAFGGDVSLAWRQFLLYNTEARLYL